MSGHNPALDVVQGFGSLTICCNGSVPVKSLFDYHAQDIQCDVPASIAVTNNQAQGI